MELPEDPLQPVPWSKMKSLSARLLSHAPKSLPVNGSIQVALLWKGTDVSRTIGVYATKNHFESGGIVGIYKGANTSVYKLTLYNFSEDTTALRIALLTTSRIEWKSPETTINLLAIPEELMPLVRDCLRHHNFELQSELNTTFKWMTPNQQKLRNLTCTPEVRLAPLRLEFVELIKSHWRDDKESEELMTTLINHSPTLGVYSITTGELFAWVMVTELGTLGMLHTLERHRRKGYAQLLCHSMCERLLQAGSVVGATVLDDNTASLKLFDSLEFKSSPNLFLYATGTPSKSRISEGVCLGKRLQNQSA